MSIRKPFLDKVAPETWQAIVNFSRTLDANAREAGISLFEAELIKVRVSQINQCAYCLDVHLPDARNAGIPQQKLDVIAAWRDAAIFSDRERALLAVAEAATVLPLTPQSRSELEGARQLLGDEQFAFAEWLAVSINNFNRISILSHYPVRERKE